MRCPYCGSADSKVTDSRDVENGIRRRRECHQCKARFTTYERIQTAALMVTKQDNRREGFDPHKLASSIRIACAKRPVAARAVEKMVEEIEAEIHHLGQAEVPTATLGRMVMDRLKQLDRVAYIRFASVYRDFQDIDSFEKAVMDLRADSTQLPLLDDAPVAALRPRRRRGRPAASRYPTGNTPADYVVENGNNLDTNAKPVGVSDSVAPPIASPADTQGDLSDES